MKRLLLIAALLAGCHLSHPLTQAQVLTIISDARFGVMAGCDAEWLDPDACVIARRALEDADVAVNAAASGWQAAAKAVLAREEARLAADSKLRPYFDAAIALL